MISSALSLLSMCMFCGVVAIGSYKGNDRPLNDVDITGINTFYSPYYDDVATGIVSYNNQTAINIGAPNTWDANGSDDYYLSLAYDYSTNSLINLHTNFYNTFGNRLNVYKNNLLANYDFVIFADYDASSDYQCHIHFYYYDQVFNFSDSTYQTDRINLIYEMQTLQTWVEYKSFNLSKTKSNSNVSLWCSTMIPHTTLGSSGNDSRQYFVEIATINFDLTADSDSYQSMFFMEWLINQDTSNWQDGYRVGYDEGVVDGKGEGYELGKADGYQQGLATAEQGTFNHLFAAIADTPLRFIYGLFSFDLFGVSALVIVMSLLTGVIVLAIVKKYWK